MGEISTSPTWRCCPVINVEASAPPSSHRLVDSIETAAPPGAFITLLADAPGRPLYRSHGFVETAPDSIGMVRRR